ncbi:MAG TPA: protein phosphatase 2C domain-containing protein, partial [Phormidium sp.]
GISRWLNTGEKTGVLQLESSKVVISSTLGRRSENQDRAIFLRVRFEESRKPSMAALVLCDGMGGMVDGGKCANLAISTFASSLVHTNASLLKEKLKIAVNDANRSVYENFRGRGGATLSALSFNTTDEWAAVNVGDSRIYCVSNNGTVTLLTIDDTLEKQLANLNLPSPPPEFRQLLQYVGMGKGIEPRIIDLNSFSGAKWFLITSDGAHSISDEMLHTLVGYAKNPREVADRLTQLSEWLGGKDNSTVAVLEVKEDFFIARENSDLTSLEVFGIPGKAEFFSVKALQVSNPLSSATLNNSDLDMPKNSNDPKVEKDSKKKPIRKKDQSNYKKRQSEKVSDTHPEESNNTEVDKTVPQLNIEFSEED